MNVSYNHLHFRSADPDDAAKFYCDKFRGRDRGRAAAVQHQVHRAVAERQLPDDHLRARPG